MSTEANSNGDPIANYDIADLADEVEELRDTVESLHEDLEAERNARQEAEAERDALQDRVETLEEQLEETATVEWDGNDVADLWVESTSGNRAPLGRIVTSKASALDLEELEDDVDRVKGRVQSEQKARASNQKTALKRITQLEEEVGVQPEDAFAVDATGEDMPQLKRLLVHGPDAVTDRVYPVHHRAKAILEHAGDWGSTTSDKFGKRVVLNAVDVRTHLDAWDDDTRIKSKHVRRAFEKIEDLGDDLPKKPKMNKNEDGEWRLMIWNVAEDQ